MESYTQAKTQHKHYIYCVLYCIPRWLSLIFLASHQVARTGSMQGSGLCIFTVRILESVPSRLRLDRYGVLFKRTRLNTRSSAALEWGRVKTSFAILERC